MKDPISIFKEYCRNNNMRYTPERELIVKEIYSQDGHFDVDELFLRIADEEDVFRLRKLIISMGIALYEYEMGELAGASDKGGTADNSSLIRRFGYKKKLLELVS